jgi:hypothetical protein
MLLPCLTACLLLTQPPADYNAAVDRVLRSGEPLNILFTAPWHPDHARLASRPLPLPGLTVVSVLDPPQGTSLARRLGVGHVPALVCYRRSPTGTWWRWDFAGGPGIERLASGRVRLSFPEEPAGRRSLRTVAPPVCYGGFPCP